MAIAIKRTDVNRAITLRYGNIVKAKKALNIRSSALLRAEIARQLAAERGKRAPIVARFEAIAKKKQSQAQLKARQFSQQKAFAKKQVAAQAVISSLEASARRTADKKASEQAKRIASLSITPSGREVLRTFQKAKLLQEINRVPYSEQMKAKLREQLRLLSPVPSPVVPEGKYGTVTLQGVTYAPQSQKERNYLSNLKKTISRDAKLKKDYRDAINSSGLTVQSGDRWFIKGFKGVGHVGVGLLFTGSFLFNAGDKLVAAVAGLGASPRARKEIGVEVVRAAKETPSVVFDSLNPTKPENWANILLLSVGALQLAASKSAVSASAIARNKVVVKKVSKAARAATKKKSPLAKNLNGLVKDINVVIKRNKVVADLLNDVRRIKLVKDRQLRIKRAAVLKKAVFKEKAFQAKVLKNSRLRSKINARFNSLVKKVDALSPVVKSVKQVGVKAVEIVKKSEVFKDIVKDINKIKRIRSEQARLVAIRRNLKLLKKQSQASIKRTKSVARKKFIRSEEARIRKILTDIGPLKKVFKAVEAKARLVKMTKERKARIKLVQKKVFKQKKDLSKSFNARLRKAKVKSVVRKVYDPVLVRINKLIVDLRLFVRKKSYRVVDLDKLVLEQKRLKGVVTKLEKERIVLRREAKVVTKLEKGLSVKAPRAVSRVVSGKKVFSFTDPFTGKVRDFVSFKSWRKAVVRSERLIKQGLKPASSRAVKAKARVAAELLEKQRRVLRAEQKAVRKAPRTLTRLERKKIKLIEKKKISLKDIRRGERSIKWVVSKDIRIGKFAKDVVVKLVEKDGLISAVVVSDKASLAVVKKVGNALKPVAKINKPKTTPEGVEVVAGNGQVVLLKPTKTVTKPVVKRVAGKTVVKVKLRTAKQINAYYKSLLVNARKGLDVEKAAKTDIEKAFLSVFLSGSVSKLSSLVSPKLKVAAPGKVKARVAEKVVVKPKEDVVLVSRVASGVASAIRSKVTAKRITAIESLLERLRKFQSKTRPKRVPKIVRRKKRLSKKELELLLLLSSKVKRVYRPSLFAILFDVYGFKPPKAATGFEIRPVLVKKKVSRKKR